MSDITERLRTRNGSPTGFGLGPVCDEAADTIEALRAEVEALRQEHTEDQGVIAVWRGRTQRAEAEIEALRAEVRRLDQLTCQCVRNNQLMNAAKQEAAELRAEVEELRAVSHCRCGDQFTADDPGMCGVCQRIKSAEVEVLKADAARWQALRHVFHIAGQIRRSPGILATRLSTHWGGWARGTHHSVETWADAYIKERQDDAARAQEQSDG